MHPLQLPGPEGLYDVIDGRYERGSTLLTSNRAPNEWPELFGNPLLAFLPGWIACFTMPKS